MSTIPATLIRELQKRTGAGLVECKRALEESGGDIEQAVETLRMAAGAKAANVGNYFNNQFLVAMPSLLDSHFTHSVTLLCEHSEQGALGLVINRPTELRLADMLDHMKLAHPALDASRHIVHWGGPVQTERGFVIHNEPGKWESTLKLSDSSQAPHGANTLYITTSKDILSAIGQGLGPKQFLVALGYAGWAAGQLETEVLGNSWLNTPVDRAILFELPTASRWQAATRLLGVDVTQLAGPAGHA